MMDIFNLPGLQYTEKGWRQGGREALSTGDGGVGEGGHTPRLRNRISRTSLVDLSNCDLHMKYFPSGYKREGELGVQGGRVVFWNTKRR